MRGTTERKARKKKYRHNLEKRSFILSQLENVEKRELKGTPTELGKKKERGKPVTESQRYSWQVRSKKGKMFRRGEVNLGSEKSQRSAEKGKNCSRKVRK